MEKRPPLLPLGESGFRIIRQEGTAYVDKTMCIPLLKNYSAVVLLSRPKGFGKTLMVSALESFNSGEADLFEGLAAESLMRSPSFIPRPVIRLDMGGPSGSGELLERKSAERLGVEPRGVDLADTFMNLVQDVREAKAQNVVLLIGEHDAPVLKVEQTPGLSRIERLLESAKWAMADFYGKIKASGGELYSTFITGAAKRRFAGVFTDLSNVAGISSSREFAAIAGLAHEELERDFQPHIKEAAARLRLDEDALLARMRDSFGGFSFSEEASLYNPLSTLAYFQEKKV